MSRIGLFIWLLTLWSGYNSGIPTSPTILATSMGPLQNFTTSGIQNKTTEIHSCTDKVIIKGGYIEWPEYRSVGSTMTYMCPKGFRAYPLSWRICEQSGQWSQLRNTYGEKPTQARCVEMTCLRPTNFEYGSFDPQKSVYKVNDTITFKCYSGYQLLGSATRTCLLNGQWSGRTALCYTEDFLCSNPGIPIGGIRTGNYFYPFTSVKYSCSSPYELRGSAERLCLPSGKWSGEVPRCERWIQFDNAEDLEKQLTILDSQIVASGKSTKDKDLYPMSGKQHNIFFLVDSSKNVGEENFGRSLKFVTKVIQKFSAHKTTVRFCVMTFGSILTMNVKADEEQRAEDVIEAVQNISYKDLLGEGSTGNILVAMEEVFQAVKEKPDLKNTKYTIIVIISGMTKFIYPADSVQNIAEHLQESESELDVFAIGIGDIKKTQIESLVPQQLMREEESRHYSFYLPYYHDLEKIFEGTAAEVKDIEFSECGVQGSLPQGPVGRILGGRKSAQGDWPWQAFISFPDKNIICGGSVIGRRWILSAAHCFDRDHGVFQAEDIKIFLGNTNYQPSHDQGIVVGKIIQHEEWNPTTWDYDIALLKLTTPLQYSETIRPICLPCTDEVLDLVLPPNSSWGESCLYQENLLTVTRSDDLEKTLVGYIAGWGSSNTSRREKYILHAKVNIKPRHMCDIQKHSIQLTQNMFCARGVDTDSCKGDSGGPLVMKIKQRWIQVGIVSFGRFQDCGHDDFMGFYTNVPHMMKWIQSKTGDQ
ncbi:complement factor B-like [Discoglossus pictus]